MAERCQFVRPDGTTCKACCLRGQNRCWFHNEGLAEQRRAAQQRGGSRPKRVPPVTVPAELSDLPLRSLEDVAKALADVANRVRRGELSTAVGHCLAQLCSVLARVLRNESELIVAVRPASVEPPMLSDAVKERILAEVRARQSQRLLPAPTPASANGDDHAD